MRKFFMARRRKIFACIHRDTQVIHSPFPLPFY